MPPVFADPTAPARPLHVVPAEGQAAFLDSQPAEVRAWLARLETEAAVLPDDRRTELRASVEEYITDATRDLAAQGQGAARHG